MYVLIFNETESKDSNRLFRSIAGIGQHLDIKQCGTIVKLKHALRFIHKRPKAVVLMVDTKECLREVSELSDLLDGIPAILILPEENRENISLGCRIYPRFIGLRGDGFDHVASVLARLIEKQRRNMSLSAA